MFNMHFQHQKKPASSVIIASLLCVECTVNNEGSVGVAAIRVCCTHACVCVWVCFSLKHARTHTHTTLPAAHCMCTWLHANSRFSCCRMWSCYCLHVANYTQEIHKWINKWANKPVQAAGLQFRYEFGGFFSLLLVWAPSHTHDISTPLDLCVRSQIGSKGKTPGGGGERAGGARSGRVVKKWLNISP